MKKYLLNIGVLAVAFILSAYSKIDVSENDLTAPKYYIYIEGAQTAPENYSVQTVTPDECFGSWHLCWIRIIDITDNTEHGSPDGIVDDHDFRVLFNNLDTDNDNTLDDETENHVYLEKKIF